MSDISVNYVRQSFVAVDQYQAPTSDCGRHRRGRCSEYGQRRERRHLLPSSFDDGPYWFAELVLWQREGRFVRDGRRSQSSSVRGSRAADPEMNVRRAAA
ncbi:hypothetical protein BRD02_05270 [Halobacteriales archaeon QS_8_69_73]|nr:MAG: hypothetical protein BRD02_05270 [Halobacteriales archaeon QS_8_69_73]